MSDPTVAELRELLAETERECSRAEGKANKKKRQTLRQKIWDLQAQLQGLEAVAGDGGAKPESQGAVDLASLIAKRAIPPYAVDDSPCMQTLMAWLESRGGSCKRVFVGSFQGLRGLGAKCDVIPGEVLLKLPASTAFTARRARHILQENELLRVVDAALKAHPSIDEWSAKFSLTLLLERHAGKDSEWAPWLESLPKEQASVVRLSPEAIEELQCPELMHLKDFGDELRNFFERLGLSYDYEDFVWGYDMAQSRSFNDEELLRDSCEESAFMLPVLDMCNHHPPSCCQFDFNSMNQCYQLVAQHSIMAGEQVFISYGTRPNLSLFVSYGFMEDQNSDEYVLAGGELLHVRLSDSDMGLVLKETVQAKGTHQQVSDAPQGSKNSDQLEALRKLLPKCVELLDSFPTSLAEDEMRLAEGQDEALATALEFRIRRKRTLQVLNARLEAACLPE